jgi:Protein of unknown function (DUF4019)
MKIVLVICIVMGLVFASGNFYAQERPKEGAQAQPTAEQMASQVSDRWLDLVDSGDYATSWKAAAAVFQAAVTGEKWVSTMKAVRDPLGKLRVRKLQSATYTTLLPGVPDGDYVVILYETSFEHKQTAQETVIVSREKDKVWRVAGYYIK